MTDLFSGGRLSIRAASRRSPDPFPHTPGGVRHLLARFSASQRKRASLPQRLAPYTVTAGDVYGPAVCPQCEQTAYIFTRRTAGLVCRDCAG